ncbi:MAG TPA: TolC family protein [Candidatus Limnocylindria bacterium]|nr:TolC family protein [Candidatus Limnocylindria bacterium]
MKFIVPLILCGSAWFLAESEAQESLSAKANAQAQAVSLDSLVAEALEKNPELNFYKAEIAVAKGERRQAGTYPNPEVSGDLGRKRATGGGLSAEGMAWSVSVQQPFEYPGRLALRKAVANRQIELAELGYTQFQAALAARVRTVGYGLGVAQQKAAAAQQVAQRGQELAEVILQRDPAGITPLLETRIIEGSVIVAKRRAALTTRDAQIALYELNQLRGAPLASPVVVTSSELKFPEPLPVEALVLTARSNNFEIRSREVELAQQGLRVDLSKNERWPTVTVGPFYSQEKASETERVVGVGVSMPLPLWNRNTGNIETSKARAQQAEASFFVTLRQVERDVRERAAAYNAFVDQMSFWRTNALDQLREAAELGDRHYRLGSLPVATYVELQEKYIEATEAILDTQREALESRQQLELLTGVSPKPVATPNKEEPK